jgi:hypothetical protein
MLGAQNRPHSGGERQPIRSHRLRSVLKLSPTETSRGAADLESDGQNEVDRTKDPFLSKPSRPSVPGMHRSRDSHIYRPAATTE